MFDNKQLIIFLNKQVLYYLIFVFKTPAILLISMWIIIDIAMILSLVNFYNPEYFQNYSTGGKDYSFNESHILKFWIIMSFIFYLIRSLFFYVFKVNIDIKFKTKIILVVLIPILSMIFIVFSANLVGDEFLGTFIGWLFIGGLFLSLTIGSGIVSLFIETFLTKKIDKVDLIVNNLKDQDIDIN